MHMPATNGDDILNGTSAAETINGLGGNDTIDAKTRPTAPGSDIDVVDGGTGIDTLIVNCSAETQSVSLGTGSSPTFAVRSTSGNFYVDAYNMEKVKFTGGSGNDTISTGERGGTVNGGGGIDHWLANLGGLFVNVTFTLGTTTSIAAAGLTSISAIERLSLTTGAGDDVVTGGAQADTINTGEGDDTINAKARPTGGGAIDVVDGGADTDTLIVDASAETQAVQLSSGSSPVFTVRSDSGNFYLDAYSMEIIDFTSGAGNDTINTGDHAGSVDGGGGTDYWLANLGALTSDISFALGTTTAIAAAGLTSILGVERLSLTTGSGDDLITGGAQADTINTGSGDDTINARTRPTGGGTIDIVDGGAGTDTLVVSAASETQAVQFSSGSSPNFTVRSTSGNFYIDAYSMEIIKIATGSGDDTINTGIYGGTINGNGGIDYWLADLGALVTGVTFTLGTTTSIAAAGLTSIANLERISLTTGGGDDIITSGAQADTINTGNGDDTINARTRPTGGGAIDVVDGGRGVDTLVVSAASETQSVQFSSGSSPNFTVRSTSGNFYIDAYNMEVIKIATGSGNDTINTGGYGGTVDGNGGIDHWLADLGALTTGVVFTLGTTVDITAAGLTSIRDIERINLTTGSGNDSITGGAQADTINTGLGNDTINAMTRPTGGGPIDVVDGGAGTDLLIVDASAETTAVQVFAGTSPSFAVRSASGNFYVDAYSMEKLKFTGGSGIDNVTGKAAADSITTNDGNDILSGGDGNDVLNSGLGDDQLVGGRGADKMASGGGADDFFYSGVTDSSVFNNAMDTIVDFTSGLDDIDLSAIDANNLGSDGNQAFAFIGSAAFHNIAGELRSVGGLLEGDVNGDGTADIRILFSNGATALAGDIIV
jgi:Ca2+-binding RTX toxin-like protein